MQCLRGFNLGRFHNGNSDNNNKVSMMMTMMERGADGPDLRKPRPGDLGQNDGDGLPGVGTGATPPPSASLSVQLKGLTEDYLTEAPWRPNAGRHTSGRPKKSAGSFRGSLEPLTTTKKGAVLKKISAENPMSSSSTSSSNSSTSSNSSSSSSGCSKERYLNARISELQQELVAKSAKLEEVKDKLSDRELEVSILQKRLSLMKRSNSSNNNSNSSNSNSSNSAAKGCPGCLRKQEAMDRVCQRLEELEMAVESFCTYDSKGRPDEDGLLQQQQGLLRRRGESPDHGAVVDVVQAVSEATLRRAIENIGDLNRLVTENTKEVGYDPAGKVARFRQRDVVGITFYVDGFRMSGSRFRPYLERPSLAFMTDLADGFFPAEMQGSYPGGVAFVVTDKTHVTFAEDRGAGAALGRQGCGGLDFEAFSGQGRRLDSRCSSSGSIRTLSARSVSSAGPAAPTTPQLPAPKTINSSCRSAVPVQVSTSRNSCRRLLAPLPASSASAAGTTVGSEAAAGTCTPGRKGSLATPATSAVPYAPFKPAANAGNPVQALAAKAAVLPKASGSGGGSGGTRAACLLKVLGLEESAMLIELVSYDTVKTLRGLLRNVIKANYMQKFGGGGSPPEPAFHLYRGLPRQRLSDDSCTLSELGLCPNGVIHVFRK